MSPFIDEFPFYARFNWCNTITYNHIQSYIIILCLKHAHAISILSSFFPVTSPFFQQKTPGPNFPATWQGSGLGLGVPGTGGQETIRQDDLRESVSDGTMEGPMEVME